jgi:hypothetical protein
MKNLRIQVKKRMEMISSKVRLVKERVTKSSRRERRNLTTKRSARETSRRQLPPLL